jgi:hypothetical protein
LNEKDFVVWSIESKNAHIDREEKRGEEWAFVISLYSMVLSGWEPGRE